MLERLERELLWEVLVCSLNRIIIHSSISLIKGRILNYHNLTLENLNSRNIKLEDRSNLQFKCKNSKAPQLQALEELRQWEWLQLLPNQNLLEVYLAINNSKDNTSNKFFRWEMTFYKVWMLRMWSLMLQHFSTTCSTSKSSKKLFLILILDKCSLDKQQTRWQQTLMRFLISLRKWSLKSIFKFWMETWLCRVTCNKSKWCLNWFKNWS